MRHMPLGPEYYPTESMGLSNSELADLQMKQSNCSTLANSDYIQCIGDNEGDRKVEEAEVHFLCKPYQNPQLCFDSSKF